MINRYNRKKEPIPVVPRTMKIVNPDGTVTRSGQLLLEQLQDVGAVEVEDYEKATFVIYETAVGTNVTNLLPAQRSGIAMDADIVPKQDVDADFTFDIFLTRAEEPFATRASIFGTEKLTAPAGTLAGEVVTQTVFREEALPIRIQDVLSGDILESDGTGVYTIVLKWRVE